MNCRRTQRRHGTTASRLSSTDANRPSRPISISWGCGMTDRTTMSVTVRDARALADRLLSRALSMLSTESAQRRNDLKLASRLLRVLLRDYSSREVIEVVRG